MFHKHKNSEKKVIKKSKYWDEKWYKKTYLCNYDKIDALDHFINYGWKRGYKPCQSFDLSGYLKFYEDVNYCGINPLLHFEKYGKFEGRYPNNFAVNTIKNSIFFDENWYTRTYNIAQDAPEHYLEHGWKLGFNPSLDFSTMGYLLNNLDVRKKEINPLIHYEMFGKKEKDNRIFKENINSNLTVEQLKKYKDTQDRRISEQYNQNENKLIVFLLPEIEMVSGGVMSICSIAKVTKQLERIHKSRVILATLPSVNTYSDITGFDTEFDIFRFEQIPKYFTNLQDILIHIPELYTLLFVMKLKPSEMVWLSNVNNIQVNILNQNDTFVPRPSEMVYLKNLVSNITMTVAHKQYCTRQLRSSYDMSVHFLSTSNLVEYFYTPYELKENLLVYSPDAHPYKQQILEKIKTEFPDMKMLQIYDMSYLQYRKVIAKAKWMITFGEGLDGYFVESIRSGTIPFAAYNNIFFNDEFDGLENIYDSYPDMLNRITKDIKRIDEGKKYTSLNRMLRAIDAKVYNDKEYIKNIKDFYLKKYTYPIAPIQEARIRRMKSHPLVSVVLATYNGEKFIRKQLLSLKNLSYPNLEIVISDDGSKDKTVDIIKSFRKKLNFKLYFNQGKHGLNENFQNALKYATGEYIALCDQDDIWCKNKIETLLTKIDDFDIVHGGVRIIDENDKYHPYSIMHDAYEIDKSRRYRLIDFVHEGQILGSTALIKSSLLDKALPIPADAIYHDCWFAQYAIKNGAGICFVDKVVINYRQHLDNTAKTFFERDDWYLRQVAYDKCRLEVFKDTLTKQERIALEEDLNWSNLFNCFKKFAPNYVQLYFDTNFHSFTNEFIEKIKVSIGGCSMDSSLKNGFEKEVF